MYGRSRGCKRSGGEVDAVTGMSYIQLACEHMLKRNIFHTEEPPYHSNKRAIRTEWILEILAFRNLSLKSRIRSAIGVPGHNI